MEPPPLDALASLLRLLRHAARPGDLERARAAGLAEEDGRPTAEGREAIARLVSLVERATRRGP